MKEWGDSFEDCFKWELGNGKGIKFWEDRCVGNVALKGKFPRFFSLCGDKDIFLEGCGN